MKKIHHSLLIIATFLIIQIQLLAIPAVIFDLNGVLFTTNTRTIFWHLGPTKIAYYWLYHGKSPYHLKTKLYEILNALAPHHNTPTIHDDAGIPIPMLMQQWLTGTVDGQSILYSIDTYIAYNRTLYINSLERDLIRNLAQIIFDPATFASTRSVIWDGIRFAQQCKYNDHPIYILSNWDPESFKLLHAEYKYIFDQFDGIVISGTHGIMKPLPSLFEKLLTLYDLTPQNCIFIDDQQENIEIAASLGIKTILCPAAGYPFKKPDFNTVKHTYENYIHTQTAHGHESIS